MGIGKADSSRSGKSLGPRRAKERLKQRESISMKRPDHLQDAAFFWDVCLVLDVGDAKKTVKVKAEAADGKLVEKKMPQTDFFAQKSGELVTTLREAGLEVTYYKSTQEDELYVLVGASEKRLRLEADRVDIDLKICKHAAVAYGDTVSGLKLAKHVLAARRSEISQSSKYQLFSKLLKEKRGQQPKHPFEDLFGQYDQESQTLSEVFFRDNVRHNDETSERITSLYTEYDVGPNRPKSIFRNTDRIKLIVSMIEADDELGGAGIAIGKLVQQGKHPMQAWFPLHLRDEKTALRAKLERWDALWNVPLDDIRNYFGEQIALYFAFLAFYCKALLPPAVAGLLWFVVQLGADEGEFSPTTDTGISLLAVLVAVWCAIFLELWKRQEARFRVRWGMSKFLQKEQPRPEFKGEWVVSPVTGKIEEYFSTVRRLIRMAFSQLVVWILIAASVATTIGLAKLRFYVVVTLDRPDLAALVGVINAVAIELLNWVYDSVSGFLNENENHRTDSAFENAVITKSFMFKFINSFFSFFEIAFFPDGACGEDGVPTCMTALRVQLVSVFGSMIVINNAWELFVPWFWNKYTAWKESKGVAKDVQPSPAELEYNLEAYESTFEDFDEIVVQFGFVTLFVVAFPIAPFFAFVNNIIELRVDSYKLTHLTRRPEPKGAYDIGSWKKILNVLGSIAVITNLALAVFVSPGVKNFIINWGGVEEGSNWLLVIQWVVFVFFEHFVFLLKFAIDWMVPDTPTLIQQHLERQEHINNVLILHAEEETDDDAFTNEEAVDDAADSIHIGAVAAWVDVPEHVKAHLAWRPTNDKNSSNSPQTAAGVKLDDVPIDVRVRK